MPADRAPYSLLAPGQVLWHVYRTAHSPTAFNPASRVRYAAHEASPPRAMYYAGTTPACALWETVLRNIVPGPPGQPVVVHLPDDMHIARVSLTEECEIIDLQAPRIRWLTGADEAKRELLHASTHTPDYAPTHALAVQLLNEYPRAAGIRWYSRQSGAESSIVLYSPPAKDSLLALHDDYRLADPIGLAMIDDALMQADLVRADFEELARLQRAELPPEEQDG